MQKAAASSSSRESQEDAADRWREEAERNLQRMLNFGTLMLDPSPPRIGPTPREEIYRRRNARLYRYASARTRAMPLLFVPNLGLSRPYIFDLMPGSSFIEYMTQEGFDFYLLDWGVYGKEDADLTVEECVSRILPRVVAKVLETSRAAQVSLLGYCMGATLVACYLGMDSKAPAAHFIDMAGPIDFSRSGLFGRWLDPRFFNVDRVVDTFGEMPVEMVKAGMKLLKPAMDVSARLNLWWHLWNPAYIEGYKALNQWANDYVPMPGEFCRHWIKAFYQENRLVRGELHYDGRPVRLEAIRCPVLVIGAREDHIVPPASARALLDAVGSTDTAYLELPGGHISLIAGRSAPVHCWPKVRDWLTSHSQRRRRRARRTR